MLSSLRCLERILFQNKCRPLLKNSINLSGPVLSTSFHSCSTKFAKFGEESGTKTWNLHNEKVFSPDNPSPRYICHARTNIRGNYKNMWYQACFIRGMTIEEALKQLSFSIKGFTSVMKEVLLEAQDLAVREQGVEFKSNLWVAESFIGKGQHFKGMRRHARMRIGEVKYQFNHYYVKLEEGAPPEHFYKPNLSGEELLDKWLLKMRNRHIQSSL